MKILIVNGKNIKDGDSILIYFSEVTRFPHLRDFKPSYRDFRAGDVRHSLADISKAQRLLGYAPTHRIDEGLREAMDWYVADLTGVDQS